MICLAYIHSCIHIVLGSITEELGFIAISNTVFRDDKTFLKMEAIKKVRHIFLFFINLILTIFNEIRIEVQSLKVNSVETMTTEAEFTCDKFTFVTKRRVKGMEAGNKLLVLKIPVVEKKHENI